MNQVNENNERHGYWEKYYSDGQLCYKGHYDNGKQVGYWEDYYPNGQLMNKELHI